MIALENPFANSRQNDADDYEANWDVQSYGAQESAAIIDAIGQIRKNPNPNGARRIIVLKAASGYGKSHLFARVKSQCAADVDFAYVPLTNDPNLVALDDHVRWKLVSWIFSNQSEKFSPLRIAPLRLLMAKLLQPSFVAFFNQLSEQDKNKYRVIGDELKDADSPENVLSMFAAHELEPYQVLISSIQESFPNLSRGVLLGFVMGLHPSACRDAQTWLRGEDACLPPERRIELLLTGRPPNAGEILHALAVLLQKTGKTLVLCFDQLEFILRSDNKHFDAFRDQLMAWLQEVPNLLITVGCMEADWVKKVETELNASFIRRCQVIPLSYLKPDEAVEVVVRRMNSWDGRQSQQAPGWPFALDHLRKFAEAGLKPSALINLCCTDFQRWLLGDRKSPIFIGGGTTDPSAEFVNEWNARLAKIKSQNKKEDSYQEAEIFEAFQFAVEAGQLGTIVPGGLKETAACKRPSSAVSVSRDGKKETVLLTFTRKDGGVAFGSWVNALEEAISKHHAVGAVAIWPKQKLSAKTGVGPAKYSSMENARKLRSFPLENNAEVLWQVLTLREAILDTQSSQFLLAGKALSKEELTRRIRETKVLEGLKFNEFITNSWTVANASAPIGPGPKPAQAGAVAVPIGSGAKLAAIAAETPTPTSTPSDPLGEQMVTLVNFLKKKKQPVIADGIQQGPTFIRFRIRLEADADVTKIQKQAKNLETHLGLEREPYIDNHANFVSIDVQREDRQAVSLAPLLSERPANAGGKPVFPAGKDVAGKITWMDLSEPSTCHLLVAGITGSGKSEFLKSILASLASHAEPSRLQFALIDPKRVTFNLNGPSPYLMQPPIFEPDEAIPLLKRCCDEMTKRYKLLEQQHKANISELPDGIRPARWVIVLDEFANLMDDRSLKKDLEAHLKALSSMARASGIHLILGTQRPEASVVTPLLRSNLPCRIGFQVATGKDSKIIIDQAGAESLLGKGDFLMKLNAGVQRLQSPFVPPNEFEKFLRVNN